MIKKKYKILGDSFKQYIPLSKNTFAETKNNKITEKNIDELIKSQAVYTAFKKYFC